MKKAILYLCFMLALSIFLSTFAVAETKVNSLENVDPLGFVDCLGMDITYLLRNFEKDIDYSEFKNGSQTGYRINESFYYMDLPEDDALVVFFADQETNIIENLVYYFWCPSESPNLLSHSLNKMYEEITDVYGEPTISYDSSFDSTSSIYASKMFLTLGLRSRIEGDYAFDWSANDMKIHLGVRVDPDESKDVGTLVFKKTEWNNYEIDDMGISISIPSIYDVFTRNISSDDSSITQYGYTPSELQSFYLENDIYLNALKDGGKEEICVKMQPPLPLFENFDSLSDNMLNMYASLLKSGYEQIEMTVFEYDIYHHKQLNFLRFSFYNPTESSYGIVYQTLHKDKTMIFSLLSYNGTISENQEKTLLEVVDSIVLNNDPVNSYSIETTPGFTYTDEDTGVTFTVPANWETEPFAKEKEFYDIKFASKKELGQFIMYGSTDIWNMLNPLQKMTNPRSSFNNSFMSQAAIESLIGVNSSTIKEVTYNGTTYLMTELQQDVDTYGINISIDETILMYIENGWGHVFVFGGTSESGCFDEFESLMESVKYPNI